MKKTNQVEKKTLEIKSANDNYQNYTGSDKVYEEFGYLVSEGVHQLIEDYEAHWFTDMIRGNQFEPKVRKYNFQVWKLQRIKDYHFKAICEDGNDNLIKTENIEFSDFKADSVVLYYWKEYNMVTLPSEY